MIREVIEDREVRGDRLHLAGKRRGDRDDGLVFDLVAAVPQQASVHRLRRLEYEGRMSVGGIGFRIDAGAGAEVEHGHSRGQQVQRQLLEPGAHASVPRRGQHEFVVLLAGVHVVDGLADVRYSLADEARGSSAARTTYKVSMRGTGRTSQASARRRRGEVTQSCPCSQSWVRAMSARSLRASSV